MEAETEELFGLAEALCARVATSQTVFSELIADSRLRLAAAKTPLEREDLSEEFGRSLRPLWIEASVASTSQNYRSPLTAQHTRTATGRNAPFGYAPDLQPSYLEERCAKFFDQPPQGWTSHHVLLPRGQSAMAAVLHALERGLLIGGNRKLSFVRLGADFEAAEIFALLSSLSKPIGRRREAVKTMDTLDPDV